MPRVNINGVDLFYDTTGTGEPILFHHGWLGDHDDWDGVVARLKDRYRCIVMDARGTGDSAHPADGYTIEQLAADVVGMADALGVDRFSYVGQSMGGLTGMELGLSHPERLTKLVLSAPAPAGGAAAFEHLEGDLLRKAAATGSGIDGATPDGMRERWASKDREGMIDMLSGITARESTKAGLPAKADRMLAASAGHFDDLRAAMFASRRGDRLGEIQTPTLMIGGAADGNLYRNLEDYARLGNATLHVFSRVGHRVPSEVPAAFSRVLADFLEHGVVTATTLQADAATAGC